MFKRLLSNKELSSRIQPKHPIKLLRRDLINPPKLLNTAIRNDYIQPSEMFDSFFE